MQVGSLCPEGIDYLMRFDGSVNAKAFAAFNLDQARDLEKQAALCCRCRAVGDRGSAGVAARPGLGKN